VNKALLASAFALALPFGTFGCAADTSAESADQTPADEEALTSDRCHKPALDAAESEYGNDPMRTRTKVLIKGKKYIITVGIGNPEDGAHDYLIVFSGDCTKTTPFVKEVTSF
jgi:hypothetical protein